MAGQSNNIEAEKQMELQHSTFLHKGNFMVPVCRKLSIGPRINNALLHNCYCSKDKFPNLYIRSLFVVLQLYNAETTFIHCAIDLVREKEMGTLEQINVAQVKPVHCCQASPVWDHRHH